MPGFSLTLLLLPGASDANAPDTSLLLSLLDEPAAVPGWKWTVGGAPAAHIITPPAAAAAAKGETSNALRAADGEAFRAAIQRACAGLVKEEPEITRMDNIAGDGDCGLTLKSGAECALSESLLYLQRRGAHACVCSGARGPEERQDHAGRRRRLHGRDLQGRRGADGRHERCHLLVRAPPHSPSPARSPAHSIFFSALAQALQAAAPSGGTVDAALWAQALPGALARLYTYTRARPPSRTLVDPLQAFVEALARAPGDFGGAVAAAGAAALATRDLTAKAGRSAYVEGDRLRQEKVPDPGAWGVKVIVEGLQGA